MPTPVGTRLRGVWGSAPNDLFAVGELGTLIRYDGTRWNVQSSPVNEELRAVWGTGPTDVYAVGESGRVLRWDGASWRSLPSPTDELLIGLTGTGAGGGLIAVGARRTIVTGTR
jgi:hypothetical protein